MKTHENYFFESSYYYAKVLSKYTNSDLIDRIIDKSKQGHKAVINNDNDKVHRLMIEVYNLSYDLSVDEFNR